MTNPTTASRLMSLIGIAWVVVGLPFFNEKAY